MATERLPSSTTKVVELVTTYTQLITKTTASIITNHAILNCSDKLLPPIFVFSASRAWCPRTTWMAISYRPLKRC